MKEQTLDSEDMYSVLTSAFAVMDRSDEEQSQFSVSSAIAKELGLRGICIKSTLPLFEGAIHQIVGGLLH